MEWGRLLSPHPAVPMPTPLTPVIVESLLTLAVCGKALTDHLREKRREASRDEKIRGSFHGVHQRLDALQLEVHDLTAYVIGPDGENGIRGDVREMKQKIDGLEERERRRLEGRDVGPLDRRRV